MTHPRRVNNGPWHSEEIPLRSIQVGQLVSKYCVAVAILSCVSEDAWAKPPNDDYKLVFEDDFDGQKVNEDAWCYRIDRRGGPDGDGFINGLNRRENVSIGDGMLHVRVARETINGQVENTGGGLITRQRFGYGYYECKYKPFMLGNRGIHTAFWQRGILTQSSGYDPTNGLANVIFEIDSSEVDNPHWSGTNNFYLAVGQRASTVPTPHRMSAPITPLDGGWFVDAYEYTPEGVIFYDNGKEISRVWFDTVRGQQEVWLTALNGFSFRSMDATVLPGESLFDYFKYYAKDYPGANLISNDGFEYNMDLVDAQSPIAWREQGDAQASMIVMDRPLHDTCLLRHSSDRPYRVTTSQTLQNILDGTYTASAMVRSSGGQKVAKFRVYDSGTEEKSVDIQASAEWKRVEIPDVVVKGNTVTIGFTSEADAFQWLDVDDVVFMKPLLPGQTLPERKKFKLPGDPVYTLFESGLTSLAGGKQYLVDRMVGLGDAIAIAFTMKVDELADETVIERVAKTGESGWSIRLTKDGSVLFRIGSLEHFAETVAPKAYEPGREIRVACTFNKGVAMIFIDGKEVATQKDIRYRTDNATAMGSIGVPIAKAKDSQPFTGQMGNLRIYNRAVELDELNK